jgi:hypothetical protein
VDESRVNEFGWSAESTATTTKTEATTEGIEPRVGNVNHDDDDETETKKDR